MTQHVQERPRFHVGRMVFERLETTHGVVWVATPDPAYGHDAGTFLPAPDLADYPGHPERSRRYHWHSAAVMTLALSELAYHRAGRSRGHYVIRDEVMPAVVAVLAELRVRVERVYR